MYWIDQRYVGNRISLNVGTLLVYSFRDTVNYHQYRFGSFFPLSYWKLLKSNIRLKRTLSWIFSSLMTIFSISVHVLVVIFACSNKLSASCRRLLVILKKMILKLNSALPHRFLSVLFISYIICNLVSVSDVHQHM